MSKIAVGALVGDGAAQTVKCGFIPDYVRVVNVTDGDKDTEWFRGRAMPFTSGGTTEIEVGDTIVGATSGAEAPVKQVLLSSGTWAGGDAAGFILFDEISKTGTFESENLDVGATLNLATVTVDVENTISTDTEVASETGNAAISAYLGDADNAKGFTIGLTISEEAKLLRWVAMRADGS